LRSGPPSPALRERVPSAAKRVRMSLPGLSPVTAGGEAQVQSVEFDETFGVALVVDGVLLEGKMRMVTPSASGSR
jgi:hypothetical protein